MNELTATPKSHVAYYREAWISTDDNSVRVTMDRETRIQVDPTYRMSTEMIDPHYVFGDNIVLELKFTNRYPDWFREWVRIFGLAQCGAAKYVDGVTLIGESKVRMSLDAHGHPMTSNEQVVLH